MTWVAVSSLEPEPAAPGRALSGQVVGQLGPGEQFLLWALRQRTFDRAGVSPVLVHGFRLAFGLARLEEALAAFEGLATRLELNGGPRALAYPLRCACVSVGERTVLALVASAQAGPGPWLEALAERLAPERTGLEGAALRLAACLRRVGLLLQPLTAPPVRSTALH